MGRGMLSHRPVARGWGHWGPCPITSCLYPITKPWGPISIIDPINNSYSWSWGIQTLIFARFVAKSCEFAQNRENFCKIATCIHYEFSRTGYIVSDIFYTGSHCRILCPITSNFLVMGLLSQGTQNKTIAFDFNVLITFVRYQFERSNSTFEFVGIRWYVGYQWENNGITKIIPLIYCSHIHYLYYVLAPVKACRQ